MFSRATKTVELTTENEPRNLSQFLKEEHKDVCWTIEVYYVRDNGLIVAEAICLGFAINVMDGSFKVYMVYVGMVAFATKG